MMSCKPDIQPASQPASQPAMQPSMRQDRSDLHLYLPSSSQHTRLIDRLVDDLTHHHLDDQRVSIPNVCIYSLLLCVSSSATILSKKTTTLFVIEQSHLNVLPIIEYIQVSLSLSRTCVYQTTIGRFD